MWQLKIPESIHIHWEYPTGNQFKTLFVALAFCICFCLAIIFSLVVLLKYSYTMVLCASCTWLKMTVENCGKLHVMFSFIYCISLVFWSAARGFNVIENCNHWQEYYPGVFSDLGRFPMGIPLIDGGMKTTKMPVYVSIWVLWTDWRGWLVVSLTHSSRKV